MASAFMPAHLALWHTRREAAQDTLASSGRCTVRPVRLHKFTCMAMVDVRTS